MTRSVQTEVKHKAMATLSAIVCVCVDLQNGILIKFIAVWCLVFHSNNFFLKHYKNWGAHFIWGMWYMDKYATIMTYLFPLLHMVIPTTHFPLCIFCQVSATLSAGTLSRCSSASRSLQPLWLPNGTNYEKKKRWG